MPKAPTQSRTKASRYAPTSKPKNPKASHLYTDDNPKTTIHGTGFKDKAAAERTLKLIQNRSLIYQFQTVNTMYNRAKHHPAMKTKTEGSAGTADMREAMAIFRDWLDSTYPAEKAALRADGFRPLLNKACVQRYLEQIEQSSDVTELAKAFARRYVDMPKGKQLGNVLVDDSKPTEADWDRKRYDALDELVPAGKEGGTGLWEHGELWTDKGKVAPQHLLMIAWAWSPAKESKLP